MKKSPPFLAGLITVPILLAKEDRRAYLAERVLTLIIFTLIIFLGLVFVICLLGSKLEKEALTILGLLLGATWIARWMVQRGYWRQARWLPVFMFFAIGVYGSRPGTESGLMVYYVLAFILTGMLAGAAEMFFVAALSLGVNYGVAFYRHPQESLNLLASLTAVSGAFTGIALIEWLALTLMDQALSYSTRDPLTGLYNRGYFDSEMARLQKRLAGPASVMVFDLNDLKGINDQYGHAAGDQVLLRAAQALRTAFAGRGPVSRIGGDEFVALLPDSDESEINGLVARVADALAADNHAHRDRVFSLAVGAASGPPGCSLHELFVLADSRMYEDKERQKRDALISALD